ncbi:DUF1648 domain-containing protein [Hymenobacter properus]|uniref:DUF1648 domain-containing protein n=1 Tax=Hymenobacter properus TaxID=2791026 RepID=A0A931BM83_9BACT|nr:DUF1648 domain-containing protein [Hymenobacter properus]MBF9143906.1 DUF1648 domain-containing protein [Hymenobacter properus]MBR7722720.1 DUF1648 domain-containing protein [Microvirga sp. SRT04]
MEPRPQIEVPYIPADKAVDILAWAALALLWALTVWYLIQLPDIIPVHFNGAGQPDRYGEKGTLAVLALVTTALFAAMTAVTNAVSKYPHMMSFPFAITPANALRQYRGAIRVARGFRIGLMLVFLQLLYETGQVAAGQAAGLGEWSLPVSLVLMVGSPVLLYGWTVAKGQE